MDSGGEVSELRLVVTADDYDEALGFYRDVLGLPQLESYTHDGGHVAILDAAMALACGAKLASSSALTEGQRPTGRGSGPSIAWVSVSTTTGRHRGP